MTLVFPLVNRSKLYCLSTSSHETSILVSSVTRLILGTLAGGEEGGVDSLSLFGMFFDEGFFDKEVGVTDKDVDNTDEEDGEDDEFDVDDEEE